MCVMATRGTDNADLDLQPCRFSASGLQLPSQLSDNVNVHLSNHILGASYPTLSTKPNAPETTVALRSEASHHWVSLGRVLHQVIIVMEFMSGGSLSHILFTKKMTLSSTGFARRVSG